MNPASRRPSVIRSRARANRCRIGSSHASPSSSPKATADCRLGAVEKVRNWWARATTPASSGAAIIQPTFHPVSEKILPAEPILIVRSAIPGSEASEVKLLAVEHDMLPHFVADHDQVVLARDRGDGLQLVASNSRPAGLCGLLNRIARVSGRNRSLQRLALDPPAGRLQRDLARRCRRPRRIIGA